MRTINLGRFGRVNQYTCKFDWPNTVCIQGGADGVVFTKGSLHEALTDTDKAVEAIEAVVGIKNPAGSYRTAFFEAFLPDTFIRGEGATPEEAEAKAWQQYQREISCKHEVFEKRGYKNGAGFCVGCGGFRFDVFEPDEHCCVCGKATYHTYDKNNNWYCKDHPVPKELKTKWDLENDEE